MITDEGLSSALTSSCELWMMLFCGDREGLAVVGCRRCPHSGKVRIDTCSGVLATSRLIKAWLVLRIAVGTASLPAPPPPRPALFLSLHRQHPCRYQRHNAADSSLPPASHVFLFLQTYARTHARTHARMHTCTHARTHARTHTSAEEQMSFKIRSEGWEGVRWLNFERKSVPDRKWRRLTQRVHAHRGKTYNVRFKISGL